MHFLLRRFLASSLVLFPTLLAAGCRADGPTSSAAGDPLTGTSFKATVRRTTAGVPHVRADNFGGVGYGYGYVFAEDNLCILAEEILTVRGERAKHFGDLPYDLGNTGSRSNVNSDAVYRMLATPEVVEKSRAALDPDMRAMIQGYAAGVSRFVREIKMGAHLGRHATCRNEPWVREITDADLYLRLFKLSLLGSSATLLDAIAAARPPTARALPPASEADPAIEDGLESIAPKLMAYRRGEVGSNMYAFGSEATGAGGLQFGNPHFPWYGGERLYQVHLTVPGKLDVQGASLYGVPAVLIGWNADVAWSHTVSTAYRFTPYALKLKAEDPLTYVQDGVEKPITVVDLPIEVKGQGVRPVRLYRSEYGPMVYLGHPLFNWTRETAFTFRDANAENFRLIRHYVRWGMAKSLTEFKRIHAEEVAVPWVNTSAADAQGNVYYGDVTVIPNVTDDMANRCAVPVLSGALASSMPGLPLLDGSKRACDWIVDPDAPQPGIFAAKDLPKIDRKDWVVNCNDSYWLTNTKAPLTGFPKIVGRERYEQSLRSRLCHSQVLDRVAGTDGLPGHTMTGERLKEIVLGSRVHSAELFKKSLLEDVCASKRAVRLESDPRDGSPVSPAVDVDLGASCSVLASWDDRDNPDSRGSVLWSETWFRLEGLRRSGVVKFAFPFDVAAPVTTPRTLSPGPSQPSLAVSLGQALAAAVLSMQKADFPVDAPRSAVSYRAGRGGDQDRIPIPGGFQSAGNFTIAQVPNPVLRPNVGYGPMRFGNSYLQVVELGPGGVHASTFVTYSLSTDPASPHYDDYTRLYSEKKWVKAAFTEAEIAHDTTSTIELEQ